MFQIWVYPDVQNLSPVYNQVSIKNISGNNLIIDSKKNSNCQLFINQDISIWRCKYNRLSKNYLPSELKNFNWIQIIEGNLFVRDKNNNSKVFITAGDGVGFEISNFNDIYIDTDTHVDLLLFSMPNV